MTCPLSYIEEYNALLNEKDKIEIENSEETIVQIEQTVYRVHPNISIRLGFRK